VQDHKVRCKKTNFSKLFALHNRNGIFECFLMKKGVGPLGIKQLLSKNRYQIEGKIKSLMVFK